MAVWLFCRNFPLLRCAVSSRRGEGGYRSKRWTRPSRQALPRMKRAASADDRARHQCSRPLLGARRPGPIAKSDRFYRAAERTRSRLRQRCRDDRDSLGARTRLPALPGEIAGAIERTLQADALIVESEQEVFTAMVGLKEGRGSFADALIAALGAKAGCSATVTFDRRALRLPGFALLSA